MKSRLILAALCILLMLAYSCKSRSSRPGQSKDNKDWGADITNTNWKLTEIGGEVLTENFNKDPFIQFDISANRLTGHGGCNSFGGPFELKSGSMLSIGPLYSTKMACERMQVEQRLLKILESADSYAVIADTLILKQAGAAPLAKFVTTIER